MSTDPAKRVRELVARMRALTASVARRDRKIAELRRERAALCDEARQAIVRYWGVPYEAELTNREFAGMMLLEQHGEVQRDIGFAGAVHWHRTAVGNPAARPPDTLLDGGKPGPSEPNPSSSSPSTRENP